MRALPWIRFLTYAVLVAIAIEIPRGVRVFPVSLAQKNDYRGELPPPGSDWFSWCMGRDCPRISVMPDWGEVSEDLFVREFGNPEIHSEISQPIPNCGPSQGVQDILRRKFPGYDGKVKAYVWKLKSRWCEAFIV
jgi:hypothetical protein